MPPGGRPGHHRHLGQILPCPLSWIPALDIPGWLPGPSPGPSAWLLSAGPWLGQLSLGQWNAACAPSARPRMRPGTPFGRACWRQMTGRRGSPSQRGPKLGEEGAPGWSRTGLPVAARSVTCSLAREQVSQSEAGKGGPFLCETQMKQLVPSLASLTRRPGHEF